MPPTFKTRNAERMFLMLLLLLLRSAAVAALAG
jgi:hypothetical protein